MSIYQSAPDPVPDSEFEAGELRHLVAGNVGRLLDPRRTPIAVVDIRPRVGLFVVRLEAFEDKGACWEIPFEEVDRYQFALGSPRASSGDVARFRDAVTRFDRPLVIACPADAKARAAARLGEARRSAAEWLADHSSFFAADARLPDPATRQGDPRLWKDLDAYMAAQDLADMEDAFARRYVSNPYSGELVKGHRIVIAELGLVAYEGKVIRDPGLFDGPWSGRRRAEHVLARLGFVHAVLARAGCERVVLYRGLSTEGPLRPPENRTFVSATFSRDVAMSHFEAGSALASRVLVQQAVPAERVFMTYLETAQMNEQFRE
ncbi:MAG: hypothetical protein ACYS1B_15085, partial [Planctomycetota bacterium]